MSYAALTRMRPKIRISVQNVRRLLKTESRKIKYNLSKKLEKIMSQNSSGKYRNHLYDIIIIHLQVNFFFS